MLSLLVVVLLTDAGIPDAGTPDAGPVLASIPSRLPDGGVFSPCKQNPAVCFSPDNGCDLLVAQAIDQAEAPYGADIAIYSVNRESIAGAVLRARARGAPVRMVLDTTMIGEPKEKAVLQRLLDAGVAMKRDTHSGIMHNKVVVVNRRLFVTGSFNFTNNATENNDENVLSWDCQRVATVYADRFDRLWLKFKDAAEAVMKDGG